MASDYIGIDRRPYVEVSGHEKDKSNRLYAAAKYAALGGVGLYGLHWAATNISFNIDPNKLSYLSQGLAGSGNTWWQARGKVLSANGQVKANLVDFGLEALKRFEESFGGIPRTFGFFGAASRAAFSGPQTGIIRITGADLEGALSHYEALLGRELTTLERYHGFIKEGTSLYGVDIATGQRGALLKTNVRAGVRRWNIDDPRIPINPETGAPRFQHIIRDTEAISESMGAKPISHKNTAAFMIYEAPDIKFAKYQREILNTLGVDIGQAEKRLNSILPERAKAAVQEFGVFTKRMTERYLRVLDQPLEAIQELVGERKLIDSAKSSRGYSWLKNILGTGGDYRGGAGQMWIKHAGRLAALAVGSAAVYEAGSAITNLLFDKNLKQVGGSALGAAERVYAGTSDFVGLTSLNKYQEREAEGSHTILGVLAFPLSGYLTGRIAASATNNVVASATGDTAWAAARAATSEMPGALAGLKGKTLPIVGDLGAKMTRGAKFGLIGAGIGAALSLPFALGALGSNRSLEEVEAEQSGETEVGVKKGRLWEFGRTPFEGEGTDYYRPSWYRRLMDDPKGDLQYGDLADRPFTQMLKGVTDPYWREKEFFYDRPYPVSGPDSSGLGPLGPIWAATIGRIFKPPVTMHEDELSMDGKEGVEQGNVIRYGSDTRNAPVASLGGKGPRQATSPYSLSFAAGETAHRATEATGLMGFLFSAIKKRITGEADFEAQTPVLDSFAGMGSATDNFWDLNAGGGLGSTEAIRRFLPKDRFQLQKINPIENTQPSWMPGPDNYIDFQHGDPYSLIPEGEYRLPGTGYEARFKELAGLDPEDYPDIHKYKILADVAPYSEEFKNISKKMRANADSLTPEEAAIYEGTKAQLGERAKKIDIRDEPTSAIGSYWAAITKYGRMNPAEYLLPISPVHKFAGPVDAISEYEDRLNASRNPQWDRPYDDFLLPAARNAARLLGFDGVPAEVQEDREITGYFDKLEYVKNKRLEANARYAGDGQAAFAFARKADFTMFGADPYSEVSVIEKILPKEDRALFDSFITTTSQEDKGRILELAPDYTKKFLVAQWQKQTYAALAAKGDLSSEEENMAMFIESARAMEGQAASKGDWEEYQSKVADGMIRGNSFPDFIRAKKLESYYDEESPFEMPASDWVGYSPGVKMDDVKLRVVQALGKDYHDFDLWEGDAAAVDSKPYVDGAASTLMSANETRENISQILYSMKMNDLDVEVIDTPSDKTRISFDISTDRKRQMEKEYERFKR